jgi:hypothetical protein
MGSIEVAMAVRPAFDYMVASVDTEPAHGFDYERWLPEVARHPEASIPELLARLVDVYLDSPAHARSHGLTLGVIALAKVGAVAAAMDAWGQASAGGPGAPPQPLLDAAAQATAYGLYGVPSAPLAVDLGSFARAFRSGPGRAEAVALEAAVRGSVVYAREDDLGAGSSGLTTFAPTNREAFDVNLYNPQSASSATWYAMIARAMRAARSDVEPPEVGAEQEGFFEGQRGWTTTFADDGGLADVRALAAVELGGGEWVQAHQQEAASPASGRYFLPAWDRQVLVYADGQGGETLVPVEQLAGAAGRRLFRTPGTWNGQEASFYYLDDAGHAIRDVWVVPVEAHDRSNLELSREASLAPGDALTFTYELVDAQLGRRGTRPSAAVTFTSPAALRWVPHAGKARQALVATDLGGNRAAGTPREP